VVIVGARKIWFFVHNEDVEEFLKLVHQLNQKECDDFLRQKKFMMTPEFLAKKGIRVHVAVQKLFEVMLTFPKGHHLVINYEYNIASAVNIATPRYLSLGRNADQCHCREKGKNTKNCAAKVLTDEDFNSMEKYCKINKLDYSPMVFQQVDEQEPMFLEVIIFSPYL
jgi:predicted glutamine amidotransferase